MTQQLLKARHLGTSAGKLTVVDVLPDRSFVCSCSCGNTCTKTYNAWIQIKYRGHGSCGCSMYQYNSGGDSYKWKGAGEISAKLWHNYKKGSKTRGLIFTITIEEAWEKFVNQGRSCALSKEPLIFGVGAKNGGKTTASLDRINSDLGYTIENTQWVHKIVNSMKWDMSVKEFLYYCDLVVNPLIHTSPNMEGLSPTKAWGDLFGRYKREAKKRKISFNTTKEEIWGLFVDQGGYCAITGIPLSLTEITASLDRIDNSIGYQINNLQWVHKDINRKLRKTLTVEELYFWCKKIKNNF